MQEAAKGKTRTSEPMPDRRGALGRQRLRARKLASGHINFSSTSHQGVSCRKSKKALGIGREVRRNRIGPLFHRWYEAGTGRYGRADPLGIDEGDVTLYAYAISNSLFNIDPEGLVALAPGQECKGFDKILRKLQKLKQNCDCLKYFRDDLGADLPGLLDGPLPQVKIRNGPGSASTPCAKDPGAIWIDPKFCRLGYRRDLRNIVLHELAHFADCGEQRFPPGGPVEEGAEAERKCFGTSIDSKGN